MIIGVDPGKTGGIALLNNDGQYIHAERINGDDAHDHTDIAIAWHNAVFGVEAVMATHGEMEHTVVVENVFSRPYQSAPATFTFGLTKGLAMGWAIEYQSFYLACPRVWKRDLGCPANLDSVAGKKWSIQLFTDATGIGLRMKDDGIADAWAIARWYYLYIRKGVKNNG
jgi:hypothetical protein